MIGEVSIPPRPHASKVLGAFLFDDSAPAPKAKYLLQKKKPGRSRAFSSSGQSCTNLIDVFLSKYGDKTSILRSVLPLSMKIISYCEAHFSRIGIIRSIKIGIHASSLRKGTRIDMLFLDMLQLYFLS